MNKIKLFFMLMISVLCEEIDYSNLDLKYYPYIMFYQKLEDKEIKKLITNIDNGSSKTGVFLGVITGAFNTNITQDKFDKIYFSYGFKLGYQSFLPTFIDKLSYPGILGMRAYVQYFSILPRQGDFGREKLSNISLSWDLLLDIPVVKKVDAGIIAGFGVGSMIYHNNADSALSFLVNLGFGVSFLGHNRIDIEAKLLTNRLFDWFGAFYGVGYSYVF